MIKLGRRGPKKGVRYNTNTSVLTSRVNWMIENDLKALVIKTANAEGISDSMVVNDILRSHSMDHTRYLAFLLQNKMLEVEVLRNRLAKINIKKNVEEIQNVSYL